MPCFFTIYAAHTLNSTHLSKTLTHLDKLGMESIVEKIIPTVGLGTGTATEYDIPIETVDLVEMDLTAKNECIEESNEDIPECAATQSSSVRESQNNCVLSQSSEVTLLLLTPTNIYTLN